MLVIPMVNASLLIVMKQKTIDGNYSTDLLKGILNGKRYISPSQIISVAQENNRPEHQAENLVYLFE